MELTRPAEWLSHNIAEEHRPSRGWRPPVARAPNEAAPASPSHIVSASRRVRVTGHGIRIALHQIIVRQRQREAVAKRVDLLDNEGRTAAKCRASRGRGPRVSLRH